MQACLVYSAFYLAGLTNGVFHFIFHGSLLIFLQNKGGSVRHGAAECSFQTAHPSVHPLPWT